MKKYRKQRREVGISFSESFICRSRCKFCASGPVNPTMPIFPGYAWDSIDQFEKISAAESSYYYNNVLERRKSIYSKNFQSVRFPIRYKKINIAYKSFNNSKSRNKLKNKVYEGGIYCKCYKTFWSYENTLKGLSQRKSFKSKKVRY